MSAFAWVILALMGVGTGLQAYTQYQTGKEAEKAHKARAAIQAKQAEREREVYGEQAREKRRETERMRARQIVLYAKSGVMPSVGTPLFVAEETKRRGERQARVIQEHGEYAYGYGMSAAALEKKYGRAKRKAGIFGAGGTLATGLGTMGTIYGYEKGLLKFPT